jgi:hypothetical protein
MDETSVYIVMVDDLPDEVFTTYVLAEAHVVRYIAGLIRRTGKALHPITGKREYLLSQDRVTKSGWVIWRRGPMETTAQMNILITRRLLRSTLSTRQNRTTLRG